MSTIPSNPMAGPHRRRISRGRKGSALLTVLWLSAALSAIAFAMSVTVRGESDRAGTSMDDLRTYYLASGAVERAAMEMLWTVTGARPLIPRDAPFVDYELPSGHVRVEIIPEAAKLDINKASIDALVRIIAGIGVDGGRATTIASGIMAWRQGGGGGSGPNSLLGPSFQAPHASFEEIEELLAVRGVTPDIFYGTWSAGGNDPLRQAALVRQPGLIDCLTVYGGPGGPAPNLLQAVRSPAGFSSASGVSISNLLLMGGNPAVTFRGTARLKLPNGRYSDLVRTVSAVVQYNLGNPNLDPTKPPNPNPFPLPYQILRWYNTAWSN